MRESSPGASLAVLSVVTGWQRPTGLFVARLSDACTGYLCWDGLQAGLQRLRQMLTGRRWNKTETTSARDGVEEPSREPKITSRKKLYLRTTGTPGPVAAGRSHPDKDRLRRLAMVVRCDLV